MIAVTRRLARLLEDDEQVFVFPSEVAAEFWRRKSLELVEKKAIWEDRFLSWDRFKEECFALSERAAPVNRRMRMLFAADLLRRNTPTAPLFASLVNPAYAEGSSSFLRMLTLILPELKRYRELVGRGSRSGAAAGSGAAAREGNEAPISANEAPDGIDAATDRDLELLWARYEHFLTENGLFEPSFDRIDISRLQKTYHIFFPEVIEDWKEAARFLDSDRIHLVPIPEEPQRAIRRYPNSVRELRNLFGELSRLLREGVPAEEIALTVPRLERWESLLRREGELYDIPFDIRQGRPLAEYPETGFFLHLSETAAGGYTIESLKALFHRRAYPWRRRGAGEELVRWGIEHHCAGRYRSGGVVRDLWREKLDSAARSGGGEGSRAKSLAAFYAAFTREVGRLVASPSFAVLRNRVQGFVSSWLDTDLFGPESLRVFQFALNALNDLVEAEGRVRGVDVADPYTLWLAELRERLYVPRSAGPAGVAVYPYRVSAGISPAFHFLVGATQAATQVEWTPLAFLRADERASLGVGDETATEEFLDLYQRSGTEVAISFSSEDPGGVELPPASFVLRGVVEGVDSPQSGLRSFPLSDEDPYLSEAGVWTGSADLPEALHTLQREGASFFGRVASRNGKLELTRRALLDRALAARIRERLSDRDGRLKVSATRLERFYACPFAFLFEAALEVEESSYTIEWSDPRIIGALTHELTRRLYGAIAERDRTFDGAHLADYRSLLASLAEGLFDEWEELGKAFVPPVWGSLKPHLVERVGRLLEEEAKRFDGLAVAALERSYVDQREGLVLEGRIDRVSGDDDHAVLVDYKRHIRVRRSAMREAAGGAREGGDEPADPPEASEEPELYAQDIEGLFQLVTPGSLQIPLYVALIEGEGKHVHSAAYYDIEKARYQLVYDEEDRRAWLDREGIEKMVALSERAAAGMAHRAAAGNWTVPDPARGCEDCSLRAVCRMKYTVR